MFSVFFLCFPCGARIARLAFFVRIHTANTDFLSISIKLFTFQAKYVLH